MGLQGLPYLVINRSASLINFAIRINLVRKELEKRLREELLFYDTYYQL